MPKTVVLTETEIAFLEKALEVALNASPSLASQSGQAALESIVAKVMS